MSQRPRSFAGRVIVLGLFWSIVAYGIIGLFGSIVSSLYGRPPPHSAADAIYQARQRAWCINTVIGLRDDLSTAVTHELTRPPKHAPAEHWRAFAAKWLAETGDAEHTCMTGADPRMGAAFARLRAMYVAYDASVEAVLLARGELAPALDGALAELTRPR